MYQFGPNIDGVGAHRACLPACLPACLLGCWACLPACLLGCWACLPGCWACWACLPACLPACLVAGPACLVAGPVGPACLPATAVSTTRQAQDTSPPLTAKSSPAPASFLAAAHTSPAPGLRRLCPTTWSATAQWPSRPAPRAAWWTALPLAGARCAEAAASTPTGHHVAAAAALPLGRRAPAPPPAPTAPLLL